MPMSSNTSSQSDPGRPPVAEPLARNIDALMRRRAAQAANQALPDRLAGLIAAFTGSMWSVVLHATLFGAWIGVNTGILPLVAPWDPSLVVLAMAASVEAIFLSTFVLMNQNRLARMEDERAELTLQISLLAEHEMTKLAGVVTNIAGRLDVATLPAAELEELTQEIEPERILDEIDRKRPD